MQSSGCSSDSTSGLRHLRGRLGARPGDRRRGACRGRAHELGFRRRRCWVDPPLRRRPTGLQHSRTPQRTGASSTNHSSLLPSTGSGSIRTNGARAVLVDLMRHAHDLGDENAPPWLLFLLGDVERLLGNLETALDCARTGRRRPTSRDSLSSPGTTSRSRALFTPSWVVPSRRGRQPTARSKRPPTTMRRLVAGGGARPPRARPRRAGRGRRATRAVSRVRSRRGHRRARRYRFTIDLIEALVELGRRDEALEILDWYEGNARRLERASALANCRRCRGLLAAQAGELDAALADYEDALAWHDRARIPLDHGRTLLALGVAQRRAKRRREARATLENALALFERIGAALWAERARGELRRISGRAPTTGALTPAEERVAALVAEGKTNREVAAALFVSDRTVEGHLSRIFGKLGVRHRNELARALESRQSQGIAGVKHGGFARFGRADRSVASRQVARKVTWRQGDGAMTPKISFITAIVGAALVLAAPAFGDAWGADRNQATVRVSPDLADRVAAARQQELSSMLDARERSFAAKSEATRVVSPDPVRDDRFRLDPASFPTPAATISSAHVSRVAADRDRIRRRRPARDRPPPGTCG